MTKNKYKEVEIDGTVCVEFTAGGKYPANVWVDKKAWYEYLQEFHWTVTKNGNYLNINQAYP